MRNGKARARTSSGAALVTIGPRPMHQHSSLGGSDFLLACVPDIETICEDLGLGLCGVSGHLEVYTLTTRTCQATSGGFRSWGSCAY